MVLAPPVFLLPVNALVLASGSRRHGDSRPLVAAVLGSALLLYAYHNALEVWLLLTALYAGSGLLLAAALLELWT